MECRIMELVNAGCQTRHVTDPLTAAIEAIKHLGLSRVALISPYVRDVNETVIAYFKESGIDTVDFFSFEEDKELGVASISPESIRNAAAREAIQLVKMSFERPFQKLFANIILFCDMSKTKHFWSFFT